MSWVSQWLRRRGQGAQATVPNPVPDKPKPREPHLKDTLARWMPAAYKDEGFKEKPGNRGIEHFIRSAKTGTVGDPWCAIWINAKLEDAGVRGSRSAMARSFETDPNFTRLDAPAYGAIGTMWRGSPSAGTGHVFFYLGENARGVIGLGGNQSDGVTRTVEPRNRIVGYYWPKGLPLPITGRVVLADGGEKEGSET